MKAKAFSILAAGVLAALPTVAISSSAQAEELPHSQLTADGCSDFYYSAEWGVQPPRHPDLDCRAIEEIVKTLGAPEESKTAGHWAKVHGWGQDNMWGYRTFDDFSQPSKTVRYSQYFSFASFDVLWHHH